MTLENSIGIGASIFTAMASIPQLVKLIKEKKAEGISLIMLMILITGLGLWTYYGILIKDWIIVISNSLSLLINLSVFILALKYRKSY